LPSTAATPLAELVARIVAFEGPCGAAPHPSTAAHRCRPRRHRASPRSPNLRHALALTSPTGAAGTSLASPATRGRRSRWRRRPSALGSLAGCLRPRGGAWRGTAGRAVSSRPCPTAAGGATTAAPVPHDGAEGSARWASHRWRPRPAPRCPASGWSASWRWSPGSSGLRAPAGEPESARHPPTPLGEAGRGPWARPRTCWPAELAQVGAWPPSASERAGRLRRLRLKGRVGHPRDPDRAAHTRRRERRRPSILPGYRCPRSPGTPWQRCDERPGACPRPDLGPGTMHGADRSTPATRAGLPPGSGLDQGRQAPSTEVVSCRPSARLAEARGDRGKAGTTWRALRRLLSPSRA